MRRKQKTAQGILRENKHFDPKRGHTGKGTEKTEPQRGGIDGSAARQRRLQPGGCLLRYDGNKRQTQRDDAK